MVTSCEYPYREVSVPAPPSGGGGGGGGEGGGGEAPLSSPTSATYEYDAGRDVWVTRLPAVARVTAAGALRGRAAACACPVEVTVADVELQQQQQPIGSSSVETDTATSTGGASTATLAVSLDANVPGGAGPVQPTGASVAAYCPTAAAAADDNDDDDVPNVELVLAWASAVVDARWRGGEGGGGDIAMAAAQGARVGSHDDAIIDDSVGALANNESEGTAATDGGGGSGGEDGGGGEGDGDEDDSDAAMTVPSVGGGGEGSGAGAGAAGAGATLAAVVRGARALRRMGAAGRDADDGPQGEVSSPSSSPSSSDIGGRVVGAVGILANFVAARALSQQQRRSPSSSSSSSTSSSSSSFSDDQDHNARVRAQQARSAAAAAQVAGPHVVRLRARNLCDGGSTTYATLRVLPPTLVAPAAAAAAAPAPVTAQGEAPRPTATTDASTSPPSGESEQGGFGLSG